MDSFRLGLLVVAFLLNQLNLNRAEMPEQNTVLTISNEDDFDRYLNGFLNKGSRLALFIDYDGTLAPIASHPNFTKMAPETEDSLHALARTENVFLAIISGRGLSDVKSKVNIENITYGGNHGFEIQNSNGSRSDYELSDEIKGNFSQLVSEMKKKFTIEGAWLEDKRVSLTYHYRDAESHITIEQLQDIMKTIESYGFRANQAKSAIEAKPPINWNKGQATLFLLRKNFGDNWQDNVKAIFAGDDTTDEDVMKVLKGIGKTFRVSSNSNVNTNADFRLPSTKEVTLLLKWIEKQYN